jgi:hypothetical protein
MPLVPIAFSVWVRRGGKKPSDRWAESVCHVLSVEELAGHRNFGQYPSWKDVGDAVCQALGVTGVVAGDDECRSVDAPEVIERCKGAVMADCRCGRRTVGVSARNSLSDQVGDQRLKIRNEQFPGGLQTAGTGTLGETIHQIGVCGFVRIVLYRFSTDDHRRPGDTGVLEARPQNDSAAQSGADKVGAGVIERVHDRNDVADVLIPSVQRRVGTTRCSVPSNVRQRNAIPASEPVSKRSHAVVIRTPTMKHDDQFAAADDLPHEGPAIISDV